MKTNNKIMVSKEGNEKIIFSWKNENKIELYLKEENFEKNSFDSVFDFIIDCIENNEDISFELNEDIANDGSRINNIAMGIVELCKKEIKEIQSELEEAR